MTIEQFDLVDKALATEGNRRSDRRIQHFGARPAAGWIVVDVWESEDRLGAFPETLMPILPDVGVQPPEPRIHPVHNLVD